MRALRLCLVIAGAFAMSACASQSPVAPTRQTAATGLSASSPAAPGAVDHSVVAMSQEKNSAGEAGKPTSAPAATKPIKEDFSFPGPPVLLSNVCSFPITVQGTQSGSQIVSLDEEGNVTKIVGHAVEQDVFTANGKSLTGNPVKFAYEFFFDSSGNVSHAFVNGVLEKVPLPDGRLFITAGRVDFAAHGFPEFRITPDVGTTVNLEGFCAALSA